MWQKSFAFHGGDVEPLPWVWLKGLAQVSGTAAKVGAAIMARTCRPGGVFWASNATTADDTGLSSRAVRRGIAELLEAGLLERVGSKATGGRPIPVYRRTVPPRAALLASSVRKGATSGPARPQKENPPVEEKKNSEPPRVTRPRARRGQLTPIAASLQTALLELDADLVGIDSRDLDQRSTRRV